MLENFIYAKEKSLFEEALNNGEVLDEAIVFIEDTKEIWNHGTYFDGSTFDPSNIEASIAKLEEEVDEINCILVDAEDFAEDPDAPVYPSDLKKYITKTEAAATYQPIGNYILDDIIISNGVYAVTADGKLIDYNLADSTALGVALVTDNLRILIPKADATDGTNNTLYWGKKLYGKDVAGITETTDNSVAKADFGGKANTDAIAAAYGQHSVDMDSRDMCKVLATYAEGGFTDWYVPACGQLYEMYTKKSDINTALQNIGGTAFESYFYWSSSEGGSYYAWHVDFGNGSVDSYSKNLSNRVRFVRDILIPKPLKERVSEIESSVTNKADKILVINHDTNDTTFILTPNIYHKWGIVNYLSLTLAEASEDEFNEYMFEFTSGDTATTLSVPNTILWVNQPDILSNKTYQCSIVNNIGVLIAV